MKKAAYPEVFNKDPCCLWQGGYAIQERTTDTVGVQDESAKDVLTEILREGARKMSAAAIESEVDAFIDSYADRRDANGHRLVVRNGHKDERQIQTGIGALAVREPRVND